MSRHPTGPRRTETSGPASRAGERRSASAHPPAAPSELHVLLLALRAEGIPVGIGELNWLHHAFALNPRLDRERLQALLACTLVKDPVRRPDFDALFDDWWPPEPGPEGAAAEADGAGAAKASALSKVTTRRHGRAPLDQETGKRGEPLGPWPGGLAVALRRLPELAVRAGSELLVRTRRLAGRLMFWLVVLLVVGLLAGGVHHYLASHRPPALGPGPGPGPTPSDATTGELHTVRAAPPPGAEPFEPVDTGARWTGAGVALVCLALAGLAGLRFRRQRQLPAPVPTPQGPDWLPRLTSETGGPELLDGDQLRTLIWGIGRFVSEDLTQEVDAARTVAATARAGGIPELRYRHAAYPREVWLWQDASAQDPAIDRLADEVETSLERAGLPVRRGWFADLPEVVRWREGQELSPSVVEGHRQSALVAVLTDGAGLALMEQSALRRARSRALLRCLGEWPRLAFVDFGHGRHRLSRRLRPYGVACIAPGALPAFLGEGQVGPAPVPPVDPGLAGELRAWAAATALCAEPMDPATAYALRRALKLRVSPFGFEQLLANGEDRAGLLVWLPARRYELLGWLARAEASGEGEDVAPESLLGRSLAFWRQRYAEERARRERIESRLHPWRGTAAEQRLRLEEALLALWTRPAQAANTLYGLFRGTLRDEVHGRLAVFAPRDWAARPGRVALPWRWAGRPERTRWLFDSMGLGGTGEPVAPGDLRPSATLGASLGLCLGLLAVAGVVVLRPPSLERWTDPQSGIEFVRIPAGAFLMGSPEADNDAFKDERPQHQVRLGPFWMARTETTNAQYRRLHSEHQGADELPAAHVTWDQAKGFCEHHGFHLPTEAQWEYAARAGTQSRWSFGEDKTLLGRYAWYGENSDRKAHAALLPPGPETPRPPPRPA
jgi:hypothetical protein